MIHDPVPPHQSGAYAAVFAGRAFPIAERLAQIVLSLPRGPGLSLEQQAQVTVAVQDWAGFY